MEKERERARDIGEGRKRGRDMGEGRKRGREITIEFPPLQPMHILYFHNCSSAKPLWFLKFGGAVF